MPSLKRSAALAAAAVTVAALAACSTAEAAPADEPAAASTTSNAHPDNPVVEPAPLTVDEFVERLGPASGDAVWLSGDEVEDEFHAAAAVFPLELPDGYTWPNGLSRSYGNVSEWERGTGVVEAYTFWEAAHATAAYADGRVGDHQAAAEHLAELVEGYASPVRSLYIDPEQPGTDSAYYRDVLAPALERDYWPLMNAQVWPFISNDEYQRIAAAAGDPLNPGTEGGDAPANP